MFIFCILDDEKDGDDREVSVDDDEQVHQQVEGNCITLFIC